MNLRAYALGLAAACLLAGPAGAQTPAAAPSQAETAYWGWAKNSQNPDDFADYLQKYPNGAYAAEAKAKMAALKAGQSLNVGVSGGAIPPPPPGMGQIVFYRLPNYFGMLDWFKIRENGAELGKLTNGTFFVSVLPPGKHKFSAATENHDELTIELDDGETQYVRGSLSMGLVLYEVRLTPGDAQRFQASAGNMHQVEAFAAPAATPAPPGK
jgi:hypothetical protein